MGAFKEVAARFWTNAQKIKSLEASQEKDKKILRNSVGGQTIYLPELGGKVIVGELSQTTIIDGAKLAKYLLAENRLEDLFRTVNFTKSTLSRMLIDGEDLAKKYEVPGNLREGAVTASSLSQKDKQILLERGN